MKTAFTIVIFAESNVGLIVRITTMILRRRLHIETLNVVPSELENIYRFTLVIIETEEVIRKIALQIDKQVEVYHTFFDTNNDHVAERQQSYVSSMLSELSPADNLTQAGSMLVS